MGPFWTRRLLRVGLPLLAALGLAALLPVQSHLNGVLWSLYCELIYYTLYPALMMAASRIGWTAILAASVVAAGILLMIPDGHSGYFWSYGVGWTLGAGAAGMARRSLGR